MIKEIGSEFSISRFRNGYRALCGSVLGNALYCFSGRTAIDLVLNDVKIKKVAMPSYCCESMIEPFYRNGVEISFYNVKYGEKLIKELKIPSDCDAVFWCSYFGYREKYPEELYRFKERDGIIIEDITHSLLCESRFEGADYYVASLRKWDGFISGGAVIKTDGRMSFELKKPDKSFIDVKMKAMEMKEQYLSDLDAEKKEAYLKMFKESNAYFSSDYKNTAIDEYSLSLLSQWDTDTIIRKRKENANLLHEGLKSSKALAPMLSRADMECPLFVPVIAKSAEIREAVRKRLIDSRIYCPVHWGIGADYGNKSNIYERELSLVCDQRYGKEDMERILSVIKEF